MHFFEPLNSTEDSSSKETFGGNTNPGGVYKWNVLGVLGEPFPDDFVDFPTVRTLPKPKPKLALSPCASSVQGRKEEGVGEEMKAGTVDLSWKERVSETGGRGWVGRRRTGRRDRWIGGCGGNGRCVAGKGGREWGMLFVIRCVRFHRTCCAMPTTARCVAEAKETRRRADDLGGGADLRPEERGPCALEWGPVARNLFLRDSHEERRAPPPEHAHPNDSEAAVYFSSAPP